MDLGLVLDAHRFDEVVTVEQVLIVDWYSWVRSVDVTTADAGVDGEAELPSS